MYRNRILVSKLGTARKEMPQITNESCDDGTSKAVGLTHGLAFYKLVSLK